MTDQSAIRPGKQATTAWEPAKRGDNDTAPRRVACQELIGENGKGFVCEIILLFVYVRTQRLNGGFPLCAAYAIPFYSIGSKRIKNELINKAECKSQRNSLFHESTARERAACNREQAVRICGLMIQKEQKPTKQKNGWRFS